MTEVERVRRNSFFSALTVFSRLIANVFIFWIIARYYGPKIFGQFTAAQVIATNFIILADFGFDLLFTTEIAKNRKNANKLFIQFFSLKLSFCVIVLILMFLLGLFGSFSIQTKSLIMILSFYTIFSTLSNFLSALYKGFEKLEYETFLTLLMNLFLILFALPLIILKIDIKIIAFIFVLSRLLGFIIGIFFCKKVLPNLTFEFSFEGFQEIRNKVLIFGFFLLFNNLFFQLDTILLSLWRSDEDVGIYQAVFKLIMLPLVIPDIYTNALLPTLSRLYSENKENWQKAGRLMNKTLIALVVPITIFLFAYAEQIIHLIYGNVNYGSSVPVLRIFSLVLLIRFSFESSALMLTTSNKQNIRLYTVIIASILNLVLNYYFIPRYGILGAATISLMTNIIVGITYFFFTRTHLNNIVMNVQIILYLFISLIIGFLAWFYNSINIFITTPAIFLIFSFMIFFFLSKEERKILLSTNNLFSVIRNKIK